MKLAIFGGGSSYTPELVNGLMKQYEQLPITDLCLVDINRQRLDILAPFAQRMLDKAGLPVHVSATTDRRRGLEGSDFVNALIRVGGMDARTQDERVPLKYNTIGQETTGPGGMMKALRTIPVILAMAKDMAEVCPDAWLINYTNPSGIIAEALGKHSSVKFVGLCSGPKSWIEHTLQLMGVEPARANADWIGLNHLGFIVRLWVDGKDSLAQAIEAVAGKWNIESDLMRTLGVIPCSYLANYYHMGKLVAKAQQPGQRVRGEQVKEIESELFRLYADPNLSERPELLNKRGGGGYAEAAMASMLAIWHNKSERQIIQAINQGAISGIPDDASVEVPCMVDRVGPHPIRMGEIPLPIRGLIQHVKAYESLTVQAAVEGNRRIAMQALLSHPLVPTYEVAKPLLDDLLAVNKPYLPWA
jgi:6-phospho-beta-glucosidase